MNTWQKYVRAVTNDDSQTAIAGESGIAQSTISRWLNATKVPTEAAQVAKFAQAYKRNPLEAFVAAGMLTVKEVDGGLGPGERKFLAALRTRARVATVTDIRDSQVSSEAELERDLASGKKSARKSGQPPTNK